MSEKQTSGIQLCPNQLHWVFKSTDGYFFFFFSNWGGNIFPLHITSSLQWSRPLFPLHSPSSQCKTKASGWITSDCTVSFIRSQLPVIVNGCAVPCLNSIRWFSQMDTNRTFCYVTFIRIFIWAPVRQICEKEECTLLSLPHLTCCPTATASPWYPVPL